LDFFNSKEHSTTKYFRHFLDFRLAYFSILPQFADTILLVKDFKQAGIVCLDKWHWFLEFVAKTSWYRLSKWHLPNFEEVCAGHVTISNILVAEQSYSHSLSFQLLVRFISCALLAAFFVFWTSKEEWVSWILQLTVPQKLEIVKLSVTGPVQIDQLYWHPLV
jgi:hypothetical protein